MSHYDRHYNDADQSVNDEQALKDIKEYDEQCFELILRSVSNGETTNFQHVNMAFAMRGVVGYPVHAFGRVYCRKIYDEWMASA